MQRAKIAFGIAALVLTTIAGWQFGACELANIQLKDDMHDLASQSGTYIGLSEPKSDEDFRKAVVKCARRYDIELTPDQVTVLRSGSGITATVYLAADYNAPIHLPGYVFTVHFTPASSPRGRS